jgi:SHS family lactate transporter-like MFS transporter
MTGFNFLSHASQDLLPLFLQDNKLFSPHNTSLIAIISNCGAVVGGITAGYFSQYTGRRLAIIIMLVWTGAFIPLWILPSSFAGSEFGSSTSGQAEISVD